MTRGWLALAVLLVSACSVDLGEEGYSPTRAESRELQETCEQHAGGVAFTTEFGHSAREGCGLMVAMVGFGTNCADFTTLKASWEKYLTEGGELYGDCSNLHSVEQGG